MTETIDRSTLDTYDRHGQHWAQLRTTALVEAAWLDRFCAMLPPAASVLDIGCGSGEPIARELARRGYDVTGIDGSATMLALFRRNLPGAAAHQMDMRELVLGRRFSGLLAWDSFFHLEADDQRAMFPRFKAHAEAGAALMFTSGTAEGSAIGSLGGEPLYHGSLGPSEYRALLDAAGFAVVAHMVEDPTCGNRTIWLARQVG